LPLPGSYSLCHERPLCAAMVERHGSSKLTWSLLATRVERHFLSPEKSLGNLLGHMTALGPISFASRMRDNDCPGLGQIVPAALPHSQPHTSSDRGLGEGASSQIY
jgi:hypothetical protein